MVKIGPINIVNSIDTDNEDNYYALLTTITEIDILHTFINEQPVNPEWRERIQKMEFIRAVLGTVALEGSELEVEDVESVIDA